MFGADALCVKEAQGVIEGSHPQRSAPAHLLAAQLMLRGHYGEIHKTEIGAECAYLVSEGVGIMLADEPVESGAFMRAVLFLEADVAAPQVFIGGILMPAGLGAQDVAK